MSSDQDSGEAGARVWTVRGAPFLKTAKKSGNLYNVLGWQAALYDQVWRARDGLPIWRASGEAGPSRLTKEEALAAADPTLIAGREYVDPGARWGGPRHNQIALGLLDLIPRADATAVLLGVGEYEIWHRPESARHLVPGMLGKRLTPGQIATSKQKLRDVYLARREGRENGRWDAILEIGKMGIWQAQALARTLGVPSIMLDKAIRGLEGRVVLEPPPKLNAILKR